ncbi:DUF7475 family protein (plasmid) [Haloarcula sp. KBTZ06]|uniref:Uncharacterized protein n=1 Tax=Haloarcula hispanica TaxID=51589 RepID=A0A482TFL7_HALHI|nr:MULTISPECIES: hypothetical protein [Haloarcula]AJF24390.1 hypothetical protein SG26_00955 [Haloarcula sp. CBA1115]KAA9400975.1 hypothetical protein Har1131_20300 [Haloarcula sp. CBA1131]KZX49943.1 hypothetical protein AV929_12580 [Haloarcula sp. K1]MCJ0618182.1 hypothetical protein [Haloarcula hispanica]RYJ15687.1 hypothetical protein ELS20_01190 [Haloarcula hispanica]
MVAQSTQRQDSFFTLPSHPVGYLAIVATLTTAGIHLLLGPQVMGFSQTLGALFILNGLGFLGGVLLYSSRYWRPELYLVAAGYAIVTILALFVFQGFSFDAFYMQGNLNPLAVAAKVAEAILALCAIYLYRTSAP